MTILHRLAAMAAWVWRRDRAEQQLDAELQAYVELSAAARVRDGMPLDEARRQARLELGGVEQVKEQVRYGRHGGWLDELGRDLRMAMRLLGKTPGFTTVVVLTLALGIGANTAIFSVMDALLLRSLPVREPQQLQQLTLQPRNAQPDEVGGSSLSYAMVRMLADQRDIFAAVGGFSSTRLEVGPPDAVRRVPGAYVTGGFFETLGLEPQVGRLLNAADDSPGAAPVAVIGDGYWERQFGRRPDVLGQTLLIHGRSVPIVGVAPRGFDGATVGAIADITLAAAALPEVDPGAAALLTPGNFWLRALARPRADVPVGVATERLDAAWQRLADGVLAPRWPASRRADMAAQVFRVSPGGTGWSYLRHLYRTPLMVLMAIVAIVLLIACANVASLLLARAASRQHEMSLRLALGASRGRIVRQLLTEGVVLSLAGSAIGTALAWVASRSLVRMLSTRNLPIDIEVGPNVRVLAMTAAVAVATGLLFAAAPAVQATSRGAAGALANGTRVSRTRSRWLAGLVCAQVALGLVLLACGGLFVRTFGNLVRIDPGFQADGVLFAALDGDRVRVGDLANLVTDVAGLPGVAAATMSTHTPLSGWSWGEAFAPAGQPLPDRDTALVIGAGPGYFDTLRIRILAGRAFAAADTTSAPPVVIVNAAFARRYFQGQQAVGRHLTSGVNGVRRDVTIVGVAADTRTAGLRQAAPETVYLPYAQVFHGGEANLLVRAAGPVTGLADTLAPLLRAAVPGTPIEIDALSAQVGATIVQERALAILAASFAGVALVLAMIGLYGVIAWGVTQRTQEIGVRLALGARRPQVVGLVLADGLRLLALGIAVGVPSAWAATRWLRTLLFGVTPADPVSALTAIGLLTAAALLAAYLPARRAARVDPLIALRHE